jgi:hypothetical protein
VTSPKLAEPEDVDELRVSGREVHASILGGAYTFDLRGRSRRHSRTDAGPRDSLQPPALRMRGEKSRGDKPEADAAGHKRQLHVDIVDGGGDFERRAEFAQPRLERGSNKAPRRVEHPASVERVIFRLAAASWTRLRSSRLDQYQTFCRQNAAGHIGGHRVGSREERQRHIEFASAHLLYELLPEMSAEHRLKPGKRLVKRCRVPDRDR